MTEPAHIRRYAFRAARLCGAVVVTHFFARTLLFINTLQSSLISGRDTAASIVATVVTHPAEVAGLFYTEPLLRTPSTLTWTATVVGAYLLATIGVVAVFRLTRRQ